MFLRAIQNHDDVIKWKHFPRYWPFVQGIHRSPVNSLHKGQWRWALLFSLICFWINGWVNNREAGDLRRYRTHYDVTVMMNLIWPSATVQTILYKRTCSVHFSGWALHKAKLYFVDDQCHFEIHARKFCIAPERDTDSGITIRTIPMT